VITNFDKDLQAVDHFYSEIDSLLEKPEVVLRHRHPPISKWSTDEQIQHVLLANRWALSTMVSMLHNREDFSESGRLKPLGVLLLGFRAIPRGRGKAPVAARPRTEATLSDLRVNHRQQRGYLRKLRENQDLARSLRTRFQHPLFGDFTPSHGLRFVRVHTRHHLKIIRDILATMETD
jgi:hypothetical protein